MPNQLVNQFWERQQSIPSPDSLALSNSNTVVNQQAKVGIRDVARGEEARGS